MCASCAKRNGPAGHQRWGFSNRVMRRAKLAGELPPQEFPDGGLGQSLAKLHALRDLVRGQVSPAVVADLLLGQAHASPRDHPGHHHLSRSEEHTSELQSLAYLVCRLLLEKKKKRTARYHGKAE